MKKLFRRLISLVSLAPFAIGGTAVAMPSENLSPTDMAWEQAVVQNTAEAYTEFALNHPASTFAGEARARLATKGASQNQKETDDFFNAELEGQISAPEFIPDSIMVV